MVEKGGVLRTYVVKRGDFSDGLGWLGTRLGIAFPSFSSDLRLQSLAAESKVLISRFKVGYREINTEPVRYA